MATVKGPLFSLGASGTVAGAIVFSTWKGRPYVRQHAVPANPKSQSQLSIRAMLAFLSQAWVNLEDAAQADWATRAAVNNVSPFNAYVSYNMTRWGLNSPPSKLDPATELGTEQAIDAQTITPGIRSIALGWDVTVVNDGWGVCIYSDDETMPSQNRNILVGVMRCEDVQTYEFLHTGLTVGVERFYRIQPFTDEGKFVTWYAEQSATPTA